MKCFLQRKTGFGIFLFCGLFLESAAIETLSEYKECAREKVPVPVIQNPSFEEGAKGWAIPGTGTVGRGYGTMASGGLFLERRNPEEYFLGGQKLDLIPGKTYHFSMMIRSEGIKGGDRRGATFAVEFTGMKNGKQRWIGGVYPNGVSGNSDWKKIEIRNVKVPENTLQSGITIYLPKGITGKAYYDDVVVTPAETAWTFYLPNAPCGIAEKDTELLLRMSNGEKSVMRNVAPGKLGVQVELNGQTVFAPLKNNTARIPTSTFRASGILNIAVLDTAKKQILERGALPLTIREKNKPQPSASCRIDVDGRANIKGKKFLPIGIYLTNPATKENFNKLRSAGFNTVMPYSSFHLGFSSGRPGYDRILEAFDYCDKIGMKLIFSLKDVYSNAGKWSLTTFQDDKTPEAIATTAARKLKNHNALLAWYTCDELSQNMIPELLERRRLLNQQDPEHPVWTLCAIGYTTDSLIPYAPAADVIGSDHYPIGSGHSIVSMDRQLSVARASGMPLWSVLQMFNWRRYNKEGPDFTKFRFPSESELRAMTLLGAGYGTRGFIFYDSHAVCSPDSKLDGDCAANLKAIKSTTALLRDWEKFLLSDHPPVKLDLNVHSGEIRAWSFEDNDGNKRIAVVALGPGKTRAELQLHGKWKSVYGKTVNSAGKWILQTENIDSDILLPQE